MKKYLVDFDGVILDSQDRFLEVMKDKKDLYEWMDYLSSIEWFKFLRVCEEIDESLSILEKLQKLRKLKAVITKIHSFEEGKEKLLYLREKGIEVPIIYTLPEQKKSDVVIPNSNLVLVDDSRTNYTDWINAGGDALLFDPKNKSANYKKIKSLKQLL